MKKKLLNFIMTVWARLTFRGTPSPECWVFSSVHNRAFNYNSRYLFCYVKEHCPGIHPYYVTEDPAVYRELAGRYGEEFLIDTSTLAGIRKVLSCQVWFTSTAPPLYGVGFRKKYRIYNLWHGIPLKTIGMEQKNLSPVTRAYYRYFFADNYTGVLTTSSRLVPLMSRSFLVEPERVRVWGQPRCDCLFEKADAQKVLREIFQDKIPEGNGETCRGADADQKADAAVPDFDKAVLYAPTFRDHGETRLFPFPEFDGGNGRERLEAFLKEHRMFLCIRMHLYDRTAYGWLAEMDHPGSRVRFLNEDRVEDVMEALGCFDLLITDYSSIYLDFLLTGRPMVFLPYDRGEYLADRGMNFDYDQVTPGPKPESFAEFLRWLGALTEGEDPWAEERARVRRFFHEVEGPCCGKICRMVEKEIAEIR